MRVLVRVILALTIVVGGAPLSAAFGADGLLAPPCLEQDCGGDCDQERPNCWVAPCLGAGTQALPAQSNAFGDTDWQGIRFAVSEPDRVLTRTEPPEIAPPRLG